MEIKVGEYYKSTDKGDIIQITKISGNVAFFDIINHGNFWHKSKTKERSSKTLIKHYYKHLKSYNTPLHKAINS